MISVMWVCRRCGRPVRVMTTAADWQHQTIQQPTCKECMR